MSRFDPQQNEMQRLKKDGFLMTISARSSLKITSTFCKPNKVLCCASERLLMAELKLSRSIFPAKKIINMDRA